MNNIKVNGIRLFETASSSEIISNAIKNRLSLIAINTKKIMVLSDELKEFINENIGYIDGAGPLLLARILGMKNSKRITGCDMWLEIVEQFKSSKSFYFIGGTEDCINKTINKLKDEFVNIEIKNYRNGYFSKKDYENITQDVVRKRPDIIFVAMGSPKQEEFIFELSKSHTATYMGLGGSFDVYTGLVDRAPKLFISIHLEWFYRLLKEPKKRIKDLKILVRFLLNLPKIIFSSRKFKN